MTQTQWWNPNSIGAQMNAQHTLGTQAASGPAFTSWQGYQNYLQTQPDPNKFNAATSALASQYAGQFGDLDMQDFLARSRYGINSGYNASQQNDLRAQIGLQQQDLAARQGGLAAQQAAQAKQPGYINRQYGLDMYGAETNRLRAHGAFDTGLRSLYSDATARGAITTQGTRDNRTDLYKQLQLSLRDVRGQQGQAGLNKEKSLTDATNAQAQLDMQAKRLGIEGQDLQRQLNAGLAQLGASGKIDALDLMDALNSNDVTRRKSAMDIYQQIIGAAQQNPGAFAQTPTRQFSPTYGIGGGRRVL